MGSNLYSQVVGLLLAIACTLAAGSALAGEQPGRTQAFANPTAGISTPGTTEYPDGGMRRIGSLDKPEQDFLQPLVIDEAGGYLYYSTGTWPGQLLKIRTGSGDDAPALVGAIRLEEADGRFFRGVIDPSTHRAYFLTAGSPTRLVKFNLGIGDAMPIREGTLELDGDSLDILLIDPSDGFGYVAESAWEFRILKVGLGAENQPPYLVGEVTLSGDEWPIRGAVIDPSADFAYFYYFYLGERQKCGVAKVALGEGDNLPVRIGTLLLGTGRSPQCGAIDIEGGFAYFGTSGVQPEVLKVSLGVGTSLPTLASSTFVEGDVSGIAIDSANNIAYTVSKRTLSKLKTGSGSTPPAVVATVDLPAETEGNGWGDTLLLDAAHDHAYLASWGAPGRILKYSLPCDDSPPVPIADLILEGGEMYFGASVLDAERGFAYCGTSWVPNRIVKVRTGGANELPVRVDALKLESSESGLECGVLDPVSGHSLFRTRDNLLVQIAPGEDEGPPIRIGTLQLPGSSVDSPLYDPVSGHALFAARERIFKVAFGTGGAPPSLVGIATLEDGEDGTYCGAIDSARGYAYFGTDHNIVKVAVGTGANPPERVGAVALPIEELSLRYAFIDSANGYGYFGNSDVRPRLTKIALGEGDEPPIRIGSSEIDETTLRIPECGAFNSGNGHGYIGYWQWNMLFPRGGVWKIDLGAGDALPKVSGTLLSSVQDCEPWSCMVDPLGGQVYLGVYRQPGEFVKFDVTQKGALRGTKFDMPAAGSPCSVRFFSHTASGSLRLALYDDSNPRRLLWQSDAVPNTAANAEVAVPISDGAPRSLTLTRGKYWLAWQTDSTADVGSYATGTAGEGFMLGMPFGPAPANIAANQVTATDARWTQYIAYTAIPDDASEPDDIPDDAASGPAIAAGSTTSFQLQDEDWHRVSVPDGHVLRVIVDDFDPAIDNLQAQLYDARGDDGNGYPVLVGASYGTGPSESLFYVDRTAISAANDGEGALYLRVYSEGGAYPGVQYRVRTFDLGEDDAFEPNNWPCAAAWIAPGTTYNDLVAAGEDFYRVNTNGRSTINVSVTQASKYAGQLYWEVLRDCTGEKIAGCYDANQETTTATIDVSGRTSVLVRVYPGFIGGTNMYSLRVD